MSASVVPGSGSGSLSGSGGSQVGILTTCEPVYAISRNLTCRLTNAGAATGNYPMSFDDANLRWIYTGAAGNCSTTSIALQCIGATWNFICLGSAFSVPPPSTSPFMFTISPADLQLCGGPGTTNATIVVTE